jgi:hypothetical protein
LSVDATPKVNLTSLSVGGFTGRTANFYRADDACTPSHTHRLFEAIGHPDKEMYEIPRTNHYYSGPDRRGTLRQAVGVCTDWLQRHGFSVEGRSDGPTPEGQGTTGESTP